MGQFYIDRARNGLPSDTSQRPTTSSGTAMKIAWNGEDWGNALSEWTGADPYNNMITSLDVANNSASSDVMPRNVGMLGCVYLGN